MRYTIKIDLDNAAFEPSKGHEVARILRELANDVEQFAFTKASGGVRFPVRDVNGNRVGDHGYTRR